MSELERFLRFMATVQFGAVIAYAFTFVTGKSATDVGVLINLVICLAYLAGAMFLGAHRRRA